MTIQRSQSIFERARAVIPGGVNSPVRACRSVGADPVFIASGDGGRIDRRRRQRVPRSDRQLGAADPRPLPPRDPGDDPGRDGVGHDVRRADRGRGGVRRGAARGGAVDGDGARGVVGHRGDDERAAARARVHRPRRRSSRPTAAITATPTACWSPRARAPRRSASRARRASPTAPPATRSSCRTTTWRASSARCADGDVAAVIIEPVAGNMGLVAPAPGYLEGLRALTSRHGTRAHLRRGDDRVPGRLRRRAGAVRRHAGPDDDRQDHRRRAAGGGVRRPRRHHAEARPARAGLPGRHAERATRWRWPPASRRWRSWPGRGPTSGSSSSASGSATASLAAARAAGVPAVHEPGGLDAHAVLLRRAGHGLRECEDRRHRPVRHVLSQHAGSRGVSAALAVRGDVREPGTHRRGRRSDRRGRTSRAPAN